MNKKQTIVTWIAGLSISFIFFNEAHRDPYLECMPVLIIGILLIYTLRSRKDKNESDSKLSMWIIGFLVWFSLMGLAHRVLKAASSAEDECSNASNSCEGCESLR